MDALNDVMMPSTILENKTRQFSGSRNSPGPVCCNTTTFLASNSDLSLSNTVDFKKLPDGDFSCVKYKMSHSCRLLWMIANQSCIFFLTVDLYNSTSSQTTKNKCKYGALAQLLDGTFFGKTSRLNLVNSMSNSVMTLPSLWLAMGDFHTMLLKGKCRFTSGTSVAHPPLSSESIDELYETKTYTWPRLCPWRLGWWARLSPNSSGQPKNAWKWIWRCWIRLKAKFQNKSNRLHWKAKMQPFVDGTFKDHT